MSRFLPRFLIGLGVFAALNAGSVLALSDDLVTPDRPDAMTRFGFPLLVLQDGGPLALCFFSRGALAGNIAIAVAASIAVAALYPAIRRDVLRTLQY